MAETDALASRQKRMTGLIQIALGYTGGKILVGVLHNFMPQHAETAKDEAVLLAGAGFAGFKAIKGGKYANVYAGAALAAASPIMDSLAERVQNMLKPSA